MRCSAGLLRPINSRLRRLNESYPYAARIALPTIAKLRQPRALAEVIRRRNSSGIVGRPARDFRFQKSLELILRGARPIP